MSLIDSKCFWVLAESSDLNVFENTSLRFLRSHQQIDFRNGQDFLPNLKLKRSCFSKHSGKERL